MGRVSFFEHFSCNVALVGEWMLVLHTCNGATFLLGFLTTLFYSGISIAATAIGSFHDEIAEAAEIPKLSLFC